MLLSHKSLKWAVTAIAVIAVMMLVSAAGAVGLSMMALMTASGAEVGQDALRIAQRQSSPPADGGVAGVCGGLLAGNCCVPNGSPGCNDLACCNAICVIDPFCCDNTWDQICADEAAANAANCPQCQPTAGWVNFVNETSVRMPTPPNDAALSTLDTQEKDYAWGDVDQDGDIDLVVVRKQPFTTTGKRANVLFLNEGGVLIDRTAQYASASDVPGDQGFLTPTNDRDVVLADVNNDGFLDIITAVTLTDNQAKHLSHPRVYINLGKDLDENWLGFEYQDARIPQMHPTAGPRFCSVSAGDVTGDGYADLYFADYDNGVTGDPEEIFDYNNKLLINLGPLTPGVFADETDSRLTFQMSDSDFGTSSIIADINGDGLNDIVKNSALVNPYHVAVTYNSPTNEGQFDQGGAYDTVFTLAPYFVNVGDLNGDGRLDLVITDDGADRYLLNQDNGPDGLANWIQYVFPGTEGFGGNSTIADLDGDSFDDVIITDVDVDVPGCLGRTFIMHNLADVPDVSFQEQGQVIPNAMLIGVHDVAVFDIDGDGRLDLVIGRCGGTQVWMNKPPVSITFGYPQGLPDMVPPGEPFAIQVELQPVGGALEPATAMIHVSTNGGPFVPTPMDAAGRDLFAALLPASDCLDTLDFYFSAQISGDGTFTDPPNAPAATYSAIVAEGLQLAFLDEIEGDVSAWQVVNDPSLTTGAWEQADPIGTVDVGFLAAPNDDATQGAGNVLAFVTENGEPGGGAGDADVDGGPTQLISPVIDLAGSGAIVTYARWFYTNFGTTDFLTVDLSNDGGATWVPVPQHTTSSTNSAWETVSFRVDDYVTPTSNVQVRFTTADGDSSITEAAIDDFRVERILCGNPCPADLDGDGSVGILDLLALLAVWGADPGGPPDFDGDGTVGILDLLELLANWGPCS
ncbi:MAG: FG-GAP-like repeat-containing protein [Planctomycetota bacterium]|nr:FG-GAP-like repeat-containing protein [Planctomycetota bacterium]